MKTCLRCRKELPLDEFGFNKAYLTHGAKDGKNVYCKPCTRVIVSTTRKRKKARSRGLIIARKPTLKSIARDADRPMSERVKAALQLGPKTQKEICRTVQRGLDPVGDALAELMFDYEEVGYVRREDGTRYFVRKTA